MASLTSSTLVGQDFVKLQGSVEGIEHPEDAATVRQVIAGLPLVGMVRVCPTTHALMVQAKPGHGLSGAGLSALLAAKGFRIRCFHELEAGAEFAPIDPALCDTEPLPHNDR